MKRLLPLLAIAALFGGATVVRAPQPVEASGCGTERWAVKTLSDSRAHDVRFTATAVSVDTMRNKTKPHVGRSTPRITGVETTTYKISANLVEAKRESDSDIHLVIADPRDGKTMIVEFPSSGCISSSFKRATIDAARARFLSECGTPSASSFTRLHGRAVVTGVGFFDLLHGQTGVAPNGIELHAVLGFSSSSCVRRGTAANTENPEAD